MTPFDGKCENLQKILCELFQRYYNFNFNCLPSKSRSSSKCTILVMTSFDGKCQNLQTTPTHFCTGSYRFRYVRIWNVWPAENRSTSRSTISEWCNSIAKVKIYTILPHVFAVALSVSDILQFKTFYLQKVGQVHGVQLTQWRQMSKFMNDSHTFLCYLLQF